MGKKVAIRADYLILGGERFEIVEGGGVVAEGGEIVEVGDVEGEYLGEGSVILPGLVNGHLHLEFSAHRCRLTYGRGFVAWLKSVIEEREEIFASCGVACFRAGISQLLESGVTAIGEISSTGRDLSYLRHSPLKGVIYAEIVGLNPAAADFIYSDFKSRVEEGLRLEEESGGRWRCGISIHSPYSVHPKLVEKGLELAHLHNLPVQAHLLESGAEREWLERGEGEFKEFFSQKFPYARPFFSSTQFISLFKGLRVGFVHGVYCGEKEWEEIGRVGGGIVHSPISNRLLEGGAMDYYEVWKRGINRGVGTDGLSSNYTLNIWEEMRVALMVHTRLGLEELATDLLKSAIWGNRQILGIGGGELTPGNQADLAVVRLPERVSNLSQLPLHLILHTSKVDRLYIDGERKV